jgi:hypothetical protein
VSRVEVMSVSPSTRSPFEGRDIFPSAQKARRDGLDFPPVGACR